MNQRVQLKSIVGVKFMMGFRISAEIALRPLANLVSIIVCTVLCHAIQRCHHWRPESFRIAVLPTISEHHTQAMPFSDSSSPILISILVKEWPRAEESGIGVL